MNRTMMSVMAGLMLSKAVVAGAEVSVTRVSQVMNDRTAAGEPAIAPEFSWQVATAARDWYQAAYQVQMAHTAEALRTGKDVLWDSGKVESGVSQHVPYAGKPLGSAQIVWWRVRVWGRDGSASEFSAPARFDTGLLTPEDWRGAQWIGLERPLVVYERGKVSASEPVNGYHAEPVPPAAAGATTDPQKPVKQVTVDLGASLRFDRVELYPAVPFNFEPKTPGFGFPVRFRVEASDDPNFATAKVIRDETAKPFPNPGATLVSCAATGVQARYVRVSAFELWSLNAGSPGIFALDEIKVCVRDANLAIGKKAIVKDSIEASGWGLKHLTDGRHVVADPNAKVATAPKETPVEDRHEAVMLRREFQVPGKVHRATAYVCGLGYHELYLNGRKMGDQVLDPGKTEYDKQALYVVHDVTDQLVTGANAIGVWLGGGWFDMPTKDVWGWHKARWRGAPRALVRLLVELEDGKTMDVVSDPDWRVTDQGPIIFNSVRSGETYDARRELRGWATAGFEASKWKHADILKAPGGRLARQNLEPIKVIRSLPVREITEPAPGVHVFHFGQNFAGWVRLKVSGPAGTRVQLRYGEALAGGRLNTGNIATYTHGRFQTDEYILKGDGVEEWSPRFCYHGFRYVEVTGLPVKPTKETLEGQVVHSAVEQAGSFTCSDERINRIHDACVWTLTSNIHSIPQDCPHREKLGWMADGLAAAGQAVYNFDMERFYAKWIADMRAAQFPQTGNVSPIVPDAGWSYPYFDPCWSGASVILPWRMYLHYGDRRFLSENFAMMKAYTDYVGSRAKDHCLSGGQWNDWMGPGVPGAVTSTAYYYQLARIVSQAASILGDTGNATRYAALADEIGKAFQAAFFEPATKAVKQPAQTTYGLALALGIVPAAERPAVAGQFEQLVVQQKSQIQAGIVGMPYVVRALSEQGRSDLVWAMVTQPNRPGWLALLADGKNTIDESWGGGPSGNHPAFSAVDAWFYEGLAGIRSDPAAPGFARFRIAPQVVGGLTSVQASYRSPYGVIRSEWTVAGDRLTLLVEVPPNTTATIQIPTTDPTQVTESGKAIGKALCEVGSGRYTFVAPY